MNFASNGLEIAIIGMSGRFPGSKDIQSFWENLSNGVELTTIFANTSSPNRIQAGAILADVELFDAAFFGFNPKEAEMMDPQHRLFLECAWEALENAGYNCETATRTVGVYAGIGMGTYLLHNLYPHPEIIDSQSFLQTLIGVDKDYVPTRVSYKLNLTGPSVSVGTACSSSLVAVHLASQSLLSGECDMALAAGVSVKVPQNELTLSPAEIVSPDGHCRAFDAQANGTIGGNGIGVVVLKRLDDAIADRDHIYAIIKGSAINNDGALKVGYTAPSQEGQTKAIRAAQIMAEVEPETITYLETHGTGTALGDPIEIAAMTQAFRYQTQKTGYCAIGSVKTNVGHLDAAAGIAGLIKTTLALEHKLIPPSLNFQTPNPQIDFEHSPFYVNTQLCEWQTHGLPRRAGVSSFGFGGTNAHVILEEAPVRQQVGVSRPQQLLVISAKTSTALNKATANLARHLQLHPDLNLADVAYTLQIGRAAFNHRRLIVAQNVEDAIKNLQSTNSPQVFTQLVKNPQSPVAFMFPGQGTQYVNMAQEVYQNERVFREQVDDCCEFLIPHLGVDLRQILYPLPEKEQTASADLEQTRLTQPALFVIAYALAKLWQSWGIEPVAMIGHSIGEYVAATLAGVFTLETALELVVVRSQLMQQQPQGAMLAVSLTPEQVQPFLGKNLSLAAHNAPSLSVVAGACEHIAALETQLIAKDVDFRRLHTSHAFHSPMMDGMLTAWQEKLQTYHLAPPKIPFISNLTGKLITEAEATDPNYWVKHLRQTVQFSAGVTELVQQFQPILLEVGPGKTLTTLAKQHINTWPALASLPHPRDRQSSESVLLTTLGRLWLWGCKIDWSKFAAPEQRDRIPLPTYPFERQRYWIESPQQKKPPFQELWDSLVTAGTTQAQQIIPQFHHPQYLAKQQTLNNLCLAYINLTLRNLGAFNHPQASYSLPQLLSDLSIPSPHHPLISRWLQILINHGHLKQQGEVFTNLLPISQIDVDNLVQKAQTQFLDTPKWLELIQACGENLTLAIQGKKQQLELLFADGSLEHIATFFQDAPLFHDYSAVIQKTLQQITQSLSPDVNLRILEIGAGAGVNAACILPIINSEKTIYTFTDTNAFALERAKQKFSQYSCIEYKILDFEQDPHTQDYEPHSFDIVIARNVIHTHKDIRQSLSYADSLIAPGGILILEEVTTPESLIFELVFGTVARSFAGTDPRQDYPFLSTKQWQTELQNAGFIEVTTLPLHPAAAQQIFIAQTAISNHKTPPAFTQLSSNQSEVVVATKKPQIADWFYTPVWKQSNLPQLLQSPGVLATKQCWLVLVDDCGLGTQIIKKLLQENQQVITVIVGNGFNDFSEDIYSINPEQSQDYDKLLTELIAQNKVPQNIVHLWNVTPNLPPTATISPQSQVNSLFSLIYLAQAIGQQKLTDSWQVAVISNHVHEITGAEILNPEKATLLGAVRVMPLEYPQINCRHIDIVWQGKNGHESTKLINQLVTEISSTAPEQIVAYRGQHRWLQTLEPVQLAAKAKQIPQLRPGGVYLITGGLGGIGLVIAKYLAQTVQAKLILTGRSEIPAQQDWEQWLTTHAIDDRVSQKIRQLQAIEALGAEIFCAQADVSNQVEMQAVVKQAQQQFGQIHGIIHAAAIPGGGIIQLKTPETIASVLAPKITGVLVLESIFKHTHLDFCILFSSLVGFLGRFGQVDYCAANAFLDAYAHARHAQGKGDTIAINWDTWQEVGMAVKSVDEHSLQTAITSPEGIEAFERILHYQIPQILVSTKDIKAAIQEHRTVGQITEEKHQPQQNFYPRPQLENAYIAPQNEVQHTLITIWQNLLGIHPIGIEDNFFALGGHSLLATRLIAQIRKTFEVELALHSLFEYPTVKALAQHLISNENQPGKTAKIARLIKHLQEMSIAEISQGVVS